MLTPVHYTESELAVVAGIIKASPYDAAQVGRIVGEDAFFDANCSLAYRVVTALRARQVTPAPETLREALRLALSESTFCAPANVETQASETVTLLFSHGGGTGRAADVLYHAERVADAARIRKTYAAVGEMVTTCESFAHSDTDAGLGAPDLIARIQQQAMTLGAAGATTRQETRLSALLPDHEREFWENYARPRSEILGLRTGFPTFDEASDGLMPGDFVLIAAETGVGKTAIALEMLRRTAFNSRASWQVFSYEMGQGKLINRLVFAQSQVDRGRYRRKELTPEEAEHINRAYAELSRMPEQHIHTNTTLSVPQIAAHCREARFKGECDAILVDYLQLVPGGSDRGGKASETRAMEVSAVARGLKNLGGELGVPVLALTQLNDDGKVFESRGIKHACDIMLRLRVGDAKEWIDDRKTYYLDMEKMRDGEAGTVPLYFWGGQTRFREQAEENRELNGRLGKW